METLAAAMPSRVALSITCPLRVNVVGAGVDDGPVGVWPPQARSVLVSVITATCVSLARIARLKRGLHEQVRCRCVDGQRVRYAGVLTGGQTATGRASFRFSCVNPWGLPLVQVVTCPT